jgi:hypothetical protein
LLARKNKKGKENSFGKKKVNKLIVDTLVRRLFSWWRLLRICWRLACRVSRDADTADESFLVRSVLLGEFACDCNAEKGGKSARETAKEGNNKRW